MNQFGDLHRRRPLERHHRQTDDVRLELLQQARDRRSDAALDEDQVGDRHAVVPVDVAGERGERAVGNPDRHRRHVLERVRHRQQEDVHGRAVRGQQSVNNWSGNA